MSRSAIVWFFLLGQHVQSALSFVPLIKCSWSPSRHHLQHHCRNHLISFWSSLRSGASLKTSSSKLCGVEPFAPSTTTEGESPRELLLQKQKEFSQKMRELETIELEMRMLASTHDPTPPLHGSSTIASNEDGYVSLRRGEDDKTTNEYGSAVPPSAIRLSLRNFKRELEAILNVNKPPVPHIDPELVRLKSQISTLTLSNEAIWARERQRGAVKAPFLLLVPYYLLCFLLDKLFDGQPVSRLYFLETVARMPYFAYITCLHTYETLGWWRRSSVQKKIHLAEEINEYNHLLVMESLGGDEKWSVRFFAQHASIAYFFVLIFLWLVSPTLAYAFSELIEKHAVDTYTEFAEANKVTLQAMAVPQCARDYWEGVSLIDFDEFQTQRPKGQRRPTLSNLYDVFLTIRDDEAEHVATMKACQDSKVRVTSPNTEAAILLVTAAALLGSQFDLSTFEGGSVQGLASSVSVSLKSAVEGAGESVASAARAGIIDIDAIGVGESVEENTIADAVPAAAAVAATGVKSALTTFVSRAVDMLEGLLKLLL